MDIDNTAKYGVQPRRASYVERKVLTSRRLLEMFQERLSGNSCSCKPAADGELVLITALGLVRHS